ncbi:MAG: hypothetical protein AAGJ28_08395 [Pseudomonadota bacterium]
MSLPKDDIDAVIARLQRLVEANDAMAEAARAAGFVYPTDLFAEGTPASALPPTLVELPPADNAPQVDAALPDPLVEEAQETTSDAPATPATTLVPTKSTIKSKLGSMLEKKLSFKVSKTGEPNAAAEPAADNPQEINISTKPAQKTVVSGLNPVGDAPLGGPQILGFGDTDSFDFQ